MASPDAITVSLVDVDAPAPERETLTLPAGATLGEALAASALARRVNGDGQRRVGIFGQLCAPGQALAEGDRIEIYRPLLIEPMEARRRRAEVRGRKRR